MLKRVLIAAAAACAMSCAGRPAIAGPSVWDLLVGKPSWVTQGGHYRSENPRKPLTAPGMSYRCSIAPEKMVCSEITDDGRLIPGTEREAR